MKQEKFKLNKKEKKEAHKANLREAVKKKEKQETNSVRFEKPEIEPKEPSPDDLNIFSINVEDAIGYIEKSARALFIYANKMGPEDVARLRELREQIDATIQRAENGGDNLVI